MSWWILVAMIVIGVLAVALAPEASGRPAEPQQPVPEPSDPPVDHFSSDESAQPEPGEAANATKGQDNDVEDNQ